MTPKQVAFARKYIETGCGATAYRHAYKADHWTDNAVRVEACRLLQHPNVSLMVDDARKELQKRHEITVDKLTDMTMAAYDLAMGDSKTPSAAVSAVTVLGKLHGLIVDKTKNEHTGANGEPLMPVVNVNIGRAQS